MGANGKVALGVHHLPLAGDAGDADNARHPLQSRSTRPRRDLATRERFVQNHLALVRRLCRRFRDCGEPLEDLAQVGTVGLLKAIEKFDEDRGISFTTYAVPVFVGEIKNYLRDHGWAMKVPRKLQSQKLAVQRAVDTLGQTLSRAPTPQEITVETGLNLEQVLDTFEVTQCARPISLDANYHRNGTSEVWSLLDRVGNDDPSFEETGDRIDLNSTLGCLSAREKTIIHLKFYVGLSQTEIAKKLDISQMHVSRLQRIALGKLREHMTR